MFAPAFRESLFKYFPETVMNVFLSVPEEDLKDIEEIRLRAARPVMLYKPDGAHYLTLTGQLTRDIRSKCLYLSEDELKNIFFALAMHSLYACEEEVQNGFITIESGFRVGIAGTVIEDGGKVKGFKTINALNIRIPRQLKGISKPLLKHLSREGRLLNTLVVSAPQLGKTTLVRDIARAAGNGDGLKRHKVCIVDERSELAALKDGVPQFNTGLETDVLDGVCKSEGMMIALRALSPDVLVTDEIGREEDLAAIREALNSGVTVVATAHAASLAELKKRLFFQALLNEHAFERLVVLGSEFGKITVHAVFNDLEEPLIPEPLFLKG